MATDDFVLAEAPVEHRARELWMQHAAGFILFQDVREYARSNIRADLPAVARDAALKAIDDALYGLMMVADGVTGALRSGTRYLHVRVNVRHQDGGRILDEIDFFDGDGACMGFHGWKDGDFGEHPVVQGT